MKSKGSMLSESPDWVTRSHTACPLFNRTMGLTAPSRQVGVPQHLRIPCPKRSQEAILVWPCPAGCRKEREEPSSGPPCTGASPYHRSCTFCLFKPPQFGVGLFPSNGHLNRVPELSGVIRKHNKKALGHLSTLV